MHTHSMEPSGHTRKTGNEFKFNLSGSHLNALHSHWATFKDNWTLWSDSRKRFHQNVLSKLQSSVCFVWRIALKNLAGIFPVGRNARMQIKCILRRRKKSRTSLHLDEAMWKCLYLQLTSATPGAARGKGVGCGDDPSDSLHWNRQTQSKRWSELHVWGKQHEKLY